MVAYYILTAEYYEKLYKKHISRLLIIKYKSLSKAKLCKTLDFTDNSFDVLISCGVFTRRQVSLNSFEELIRILKSEGMFLLALRVENNDFYYNQLKKYYIDGILDEVFKTRFNVLSNCNHELVLARLC